MDMMKVYLIEMCPQKIFGHHIKNEVLLEYVDIIILRWLSFLNMYDLNHDYLLQILDEDMQLHGEKKKIEVFF
jgi:hypothetical protein